MQKQAKEVIKESLDELKIKLKKLLGRDLTVEDDLIISYAFGAGFDYGVYALVGDKKWKHLMN